jgi:hypothetical protein
LAVLYAAVEEAERRLGISGAIDAQAERRGHIAFRLDRAWSTKPIINWLLARGYHATAALQAGRLLPWIEEIEQWDDVPGKDWATAELTSSLGFVRPTVQWVLRIPAQSGPPAYSYDILISSQVDVVRETLAACYAKHTTTIPSPTVNAEEHDPRRLLEQLQKDRAYWATARHDLERQLMRLRERAYAIIASHDMTTQALATELFEIGHVLAAEAEGEESRLLAAEADIARRIGEEDASRNGVGSLGSRQASVRLGTVQHAHGPARQNRARLAVAAFVTALALLVGIGSVFAGDRWESKKSVAVVASAVLPSATVAIEAGAIKAAAPPAATARANEARTSNVVAAPVPPVPVLQAPMGQRAPATAVVPTTLLADTGLGGGAPQRALWDTWIVAGLLVVVTTSAVLRRSTPR